MEKSFIETGNHGVESKKSLVARLGKVMKVLPALAVMASLALAGCGGSSAGKDKAKADSAAVDSGAVKKETAMVPVGKGDLRLFDLHGNVSKCQTKNSEGETATEGFDKDGLWTSHNNKPLSKFGSEFKRNAKKELYSYAWNTEYYYVEDYTYKFDDATRRVKSMEYGCPEETATYTYFYDDNGDLAKIVMDCEYMEMGADETEKYQVIKKYTIESRDEQGNWTKRTWKDNNGQVVTERRTIVYY